jgi:hypothetical protein
MSVENEIIFVDEAECDLCGIEGAYLIDGELYCARCLNANIPAEELFDEEEYREDDPATY